MVYGKSCEMLVEEIDALMQEFPHVKNDIGYGYRRTFTNGHWFDLIDYSKKSMYVLRVGRGARLVRQYPVLQGRFDDVMKVLAKTVIPDVASLHQKHMIGVLRLLHAAPAGIGAFD